MKSKILIASILFIASWFHDIRANESLDSLWNVYHSEKKDTSKITLLLEVIGLEYENTQPDSAIYCYNLASQLSDSLLQLELTEKEAITVKYLHAKSYLYIGIVYYIQGKNELALSSFYSSLRIYEELNDLRQMAAGNTNIGVIQMIMGNNDKALEYYTNAADLYKQVNDSVGMSACYMNMGINLKNLDKYNEAIEFYSKALKIKTEINDVKGMANCYTNIGIIQYDLGNIDQAILYYKNSAEIYESMNEVHGMATVFGNLADIYSTKAQDETSNATQTFMDSALYYGKKAIDYAQSIKSISLEFEVSEILYNIYKLIEDKDNAIFYADEVIRLKDTLYSAEKSKALTEMTTKYETEKHQLIIRQQQDSIARHVAENKVIILERNREKADRIIAEENQQEAEHKAAIEEKEKEAYKAENERDKIIIYSFIVGFVLLGLMAVLIYRSYRIKQRINKILRSQNDEIRQKNEEITSQRDEIAAQRDQLDDALTELKETQDQLIESEKMASLGSLVTGVAHEINTPVSIGITASSSMSENTKKLAELIKSGKMTMQELQKYIQDIYKSSNLILKNLKRTGDLVQNFKQISIDQQSESQRIFELKSYLESVTHGFKNDLDTETITLSITGENIELDSYPIAFAQIITGLISNSIKYGFTNQEDKEIKINISQEKQNLIITFSDNGHGIKQEIINKIFDPFFTTNKALGTGLGLHIIYNLVKQKLSGTIDCTSIENQHTTFTLIFPNILNKL